MLRALPQATPDPPPPNEWRKPGVTNRSIRRVLLKRQNAVCIAVQPPWSSWKTRPTTWHRPSGVLKGHLSSLAEAPSAALVRQAMHEADYPGVLLGSLGVNARLEAGAVVTDWIDLRDVVSRVVSRHRSLAGHPEERLFSPRGGRWSGPHRGRA